MGIHLYPEELVEQRLLDDGTAITVRPIRPEDADIEQEFVRMLSRETKRLRFMQTLDELSPAMLRRFTEIDYGQDMALIVTEQDGTGAERQRGVARYAANPDGQSCEFAIVVADDRRERGIGTALMEGIMRAARAQGLVRMEGHVLADNTRMLQLMRDLGFSIRRAPDDPALYLVEREL